MFLAYHYFYTSIVILTSAFLANSDVLKDMACEDDTGSSSFENSSEEQVNLKWDDLTIDGQFIFIMLSLNLNILIINFIL